MFVIQRDLTIYKSSVHAEWLKAVATLKVENGSYLVKYTARLDTGSELKLKLDPVICGLSEKALAAGVISAIRLYYASDLLKFMIEHPSVSGKTLKEGCEIVIKIRKADADERIIHLSPEVHMRRVFKEIILHCNSFRNGKYHRRHMVVLLYGLFGINLNLTASRDVLDSTLSAIQVTDFGIRDVDVAETFLRGIKNLRQGTPLPSHSDTINTIDDLLVLHGRPVVRPTPSSIFLREVLLKVKSSPFFQENKSTPQPPETIPF